MCRSTAEGGRRCGGYIRTKFEGLDQWQEELEERTTAYEEKKTAVNLRRKRAAENQVDRFTTALNGVSREEIWAAQTSNNLGGDGLDEVLPVTLRTSEWDQLTAEAEKEGFATRSALIRHRAGALPVLQPYLSDQNRLQARYDRDGKIGRAPTQGGNVQREHRGVRVTKEGLKKLEAEAALFHITVSDYLRAKVLGRDPRVLGRHISPQKVDETRHALHQEEQAAGVTPQNVQEFHHNRIREAWQRVEAEREAENDDPEVSEEQMPTAA